MFWVILLIYVMSFFLIVAVEVDNTYDIEAVNYNGYLPLYVEDYLRSKDYITISHPPGVVSYFVGSDVDIDDDVFKLVLSNVMIYIELYTTLEGYYFVDYMSINRYSSGAWSIYATIGSQHYVESGSSTFPYLEFIGFSNYEVSS